MSQADLAAALGGPASHVSAVERGEQNVTLTTLARLAQAVGTEPSQLLSKNLSVSTTGCGAAPGSGSSRVEALTLLLQFVARELALMSEPQEAGTEATDRLVRELDRIARGLRGRD
jgi:transcriptional regulator with XRE-family HTH domain